MSQREKKPGMSFLVDALGQIAEQRKIKTELDKYKTILSGKAKVLLESYGQRQNDYLVTIPVILSQKGKKLATFSVHETPDKAGFRIKTTDPTGEEEDFFVVEHSVAKNWQGEHASLCDIQNVISLIDVLQEALEK